MMLIGFDASIPFCPHRWGRRCVRAANRSSADSAARNESSQGVLSEIFSCSVPKEMYST